MTVRVAVDVTPMLGRATGVGVLTRGLLDHLPHDVQVREYALSLRAGRRHGQRLPMPAGFLLALWSRVDVPPIEVFTGEVDVVHGTNFVVPPARRAGRVVTVHDLTAVRYPELATATSRRYPSLVRRAAACGAWVHVTNAYVADEVVEVLSVDRERVVVVTPGIPAVAQVTPRPGRYVLALGTVEPRKDLVTLVRAFDEIGGADPEVRLAIVGADGWGSVAVREAIVASSHRERIERVGWVDDLDRARWLRGAAVLAYPSLYEGFGFPPLEAMSVGVPVVATAAGAMPHVLGSAADLVPPGDADALAAAVLAALADPAPMAARGRAHVAGFDWTSAGRELGDLYARAAQ